MTQLPDMKGAVSADWSLTVLFLFCLHPRPLDQAGAAPGYVARYPGLGEDYETLCGRKGVSSGFC